jgi:inosose dehydratase
MKVAAAPISWGVSELPGWGLRMPPERVLTEMKAAGFEATELGPPGYLPGNPQSCRQLLDRHGLRLVAGFLAVVLHDSSALGDVEREAKALAAAGAKMLVLAASMPGESYDGHHQLSSAEWRALAVNLIAAQNIATAHGLGVSFHPHVGTAIEDHEQVVELLAASEIGLCLDTGHFFLGGIDPTRFARDAGSRINHVHLKDIDMEIAAAFRAHDLSYADAVKKGLYRPLGQGGLDMDAILSGLRETGYDGWFVLEQDMAIAVEPPAGRGPIEAARQSLIYFRRVFGREATVDSPR